MLYNLAQGQSIMVYGYLPGAWANVVGSLLIVMPLMCIPAFLFFSLYKVGATICISRPDEAEIAVCLTPIVCSQNSQTMTTPASDLRQARPHKPLLTLCGRVVIRSRTQPNRREDGCDEMKVEETRGV